MSGADDLVARLMDNHRVFGDCLAGNLFGEAADRIERLEAAMIHLAAIRPQYSYITADSLPLASTDWEPGSPYDRGLRDAYNQINALANRYLTGDAP